jgi:hypothetical protein
MQLGKTLVGAIIGGVLGIGLCIAVYYLTEGFDKPWLAIPVAILTGLGVRSMVQTKGHPSYARGALTAIIAVLAFLAFYPAVAMLTTKAAARPIVAQNATQRAQAPEDDAGDDAAADAAPAPAVDAERERTNVAPGGMRNPRQQPWSVFEIIALSLAAFIAYELGRGSGLAHPTVAEGTVSRDQEPAHVTAGQSLPPAD